MVEFGKTLNELVKSDWRCHAVAYMELKRTISDNGRDGKGTAYTQPPRGGVDVRCGIEGVNGCVDPSAAAPPAANNNDGDDAHSVHTESSYCISAEQKANFFRIYEDSIRRLTSFYESRVRWARGEYGRLEREVGNATRAGKNSNSVNEGDLASEAQTAAPTTLLMDKITNFSRDLSLVLEFLELNATAFSKILKKFDKRTRSKLREAKLKELKALHPYLYDGGEIKVWQSKCTDWAKELQLVLQQHSNSLVASLPPLSPRTPKKAIVVKGGGDEKPHESSKITVQSDKEQLRSGSSVRFKVAPKIGKGRRSIHKTKESQMLEEMIERVNEELCHQKADSPFFDKELEKNPPPSFTSSEVAYAEKLGQGEFCSIYEVKSFNVPEGCHICLLHRGYNDPDPFLKSVLKASKLVEAESTQGEIPKTVIANIPDNACVQCEDSKPASEPTNSSGQHTKTHQRRDTKGSAFSFKYDANISDYDSLESDHEDDGDLFMQTVTRGFMKDHCLRNGEARYAIKRIRSDLVGREEITDAAIDLAREAEFLASLTHPNIIRIRGTINFPGHPKYSLILDRLYDTLEVQTVKWKAAMKKYQGKFKGLIGKKRSSLDKLWMDRLVAVYNLSRAMAYLHRHGILHRDIKPANIGFDVRGDIKLFDFGLAKELKPIDREGDDKFKTSGLAGTRRYMAPEVVQILPYGLSSDVYSFGILFWEILSLKSAFAKYKRDQHYKEVVVEGKRPKIPKTWPFVIKDLMERMWHKKPSERPTFQSVSQMIKFSFPEDRAESSERSNDLLLRSIRSHINADDARPIHVASDHDEEYQEEPDHNENASSDALSVSIRIKAPHLQLRETMATDK